MMGDSLLAIIKEKIPDVDVRKERYIVDTSEVDDELMEIFVEQMEINVVALRDAQKRSAFDEAANEAHSIKGMGGTAGMPEISVLAETIEKCVHAEEYDRFDELSQLLERCLVIVKEKIF